MNGWSHIGLSGVNPRGLIIWKGIPSDVENPVQGKLGVDKLFFHYTYIKNIYD